MHDKWFSLQDVLVGGFCIGHPWYFSEIHENEGFEQNQQLNCKLCPTNDTKDYRSLLSTLINQPDAS